jgi:hypothetical protein
MKNMLATTTAQIRSVPPETMGNIAIKMNAALKTSPKMRSETISTDSTLTKVS